MSDLGQGIDFTCQVWDKVQILHVRSGTGYRFYMSGLGQGTDFTCQVWDRVQILHVRSGTGYRFYMSGQGQDTDFSCQVRDRVQILHVRSGTGYRFYMSGLTFDIWKCFISRTLHITSIANANAKLSGTGYRFYMSSLGQGTDFTYPVWNRVQNLVTGLQQICWWNGITCIID